MIAAGYNGPARYASPTSAGEEVLEALPERRYKHVEDLADAVGITVGGLRARLRILERKGHVQARPNDWGRHEWKLTAAGVEWRRRLKMREAEAA